MQMLLSQMPLCSLSLWRTITSQTSVQSLFPLWRPTSPTHSTYLQAQLFLEGGSQTLCILLTTVPLYSSCVLIWLSFLLDYKLYLGCSFWNLSQVCLLERLRVRQVGSESSHLLVHFQVPTRALYGAKAESWKCNTQISYMVTGTLLSPPGWGAASPGLLCEWKCTQELYWDVNLCLW